MSVEYAHCARCDKTIRPVGTLAQGRGVVDACPVCLLPVAEQIAPVLLAATKASVKAPKPPATPLNTTKPRQARTTFVDSAKRRLDALERRIAAMRGLEAEAATLRRMIAAAEETKIKQNNGYANSADWSS